MSLTWQDPPTARQHRRISWVNETAELKEAPGRWAFLTTKNTPHGATSLVYAINVGQLKAFQPAGHFQAAARGNDVYARYLGEGQLP